MKSFSLLLAACVLSGCVDVGQVTLHPETTTGYFSGHRYRVEQCLEGVAASQRHLLQPDDPLPDGSHRFNLLNAQSEVVAWVEVGHFSAGQTSAQFYYGPNHPETKATISTMIARCGSLRD